MAKWQIDATVSCQNDQAPKSLRKERALKDLKIVRFESFFFFLKKKTYLFLFFRLGPLLRLQLFFGPTVPVAIKLFNRNLQCGLTIEQRILDTNARKQPP